LEIIRFIYYWEECGMHFIVFLIIGGIAGWLAGLLIKGKGFGLLGNIVIGIIGGLIGGFLFNLLRISAGGLVGAFITAFVGAVVLVYVVNLIKR
jgi:uncharacterized membrane protein YeaQ/YmgE (transglycosylase-associated protein family)